MTGLTISADQLQAKLDQLLPRLSAGESVAIMRGGMHVATLVPPGGNGTHSPRAPGLYEGQVWMSDDFDAPLDEFREYAE